MDFLVNGVWSECGLVRRQPASDNRLITMRREGGRDGNYYFSGGGGLEDTLRSPNAVSFWRKVRRESPSQRAA